MSKQTKKMIVPKLRFPKFRNAGEWEEKQLSSILEYERPDKYIVTDTNYGHTGIPVLTANKSFVLGYTQEKHGIYENIPVIIFDDFTVDKKYVDFPFKVKSSAIKILRTKAKDDLRFIYELMALIRFESKEHKRYYISAYQNLLVPVPNPDEQKKVADCLSSIDDLISAQMQKLDALKAHKKSLMQQLFPAEGKTMPKLRFPKFRNAGEWEEKQLSSILEYERPDKYIVTDTNYGHTGIPVLTANKSFVLGYTQEKHGIYENIPVIIFDDFTVDKKYVDFPFKVKSSAIKILRTKAKDDLRFIYELMALIRFESKEHKRYYISAYQNLLVPVPNPVEQKKIADCISSIDDLISAQIQKLDALKTHKKGLVRQLFPTINETGK